MYLSYIKPKFVGTRRKKETHILKSYRANQKENVSMNILESTLEEEHSKNEVSDKKVQTPPLFPDKTSITNHSSQHIKCEAHRDIADEDSEYDDNEKYAISKIKDAVMQLMNRRDLPPRITFIDFAGQSMYYAFHQIYLSPKACAILVLDMTKGFEEKIDIADTDEKGCSHLKSWTYKGN